MINALQIAWDDSVLPFQLDRADMRGRVVRLDGVLDQILEQHAYPDPIAALVAEAAILTTMIGQTIDLRWRLSLQIRGGGPVRLIATDFFGAKAAGEEAKLRAYAGFDANRLDEIEAGGIGLLGKAVFGMTIDQGAGSRPYQGITPVTGGSLADSAATYFAQSEQIPTRFKIEALKIDGHWRTGGVMLQKMPKASPLRKDTEAESGLLEPADILSADDHEVWTRVNMLLDTAEQSELIGPSVSPDALLIRLFHEEAPRVFEAQQLRFGCTCSPEKVVAAMAQYSARDIGHMTDPSGKLTADCQFCGAHYAFDPSSLGFDTDR